MIFIVISCIGKQHESAIKSEAENLNQRTPVLKLTDNLDERVFMCYINNVILRIINFSNSIGI